MRFSSRITAPLVALLMLGGCSDSGADGYANIAFIGKAEELSVKGLRLPRIAQHVSAATAEGLVALNQDGEIVPALAERWIVTDDGLSYIFRLRNTDWADGKPVSGEEVRDALNRTRQQLRGTSLALDLAKITEIHARTGRVVEIRLSSPMPDLLQLLAQPELGLRHKGKGLGPMQVKLERGSAVLTPMPPEARGLPEDPEWLDKTRPVRLRPLSAADAVAAFGNGEVDTVLGGTLANLPLADQGPLSRGTVRLDAALGLLGLKVRKTDGFLGTAENREAISMAIDRQNLLQPFNIGGWVPTTRLVAPGLPDDTGAVAERWQDMTLEDRVAEAGRRVSAWKARQDGEDGQELVLALSMPEGPGADILFGQLAEDLGAAGITLALAKDPAKADLQLVDRVARFGGARWFLNQFNCNISRVLCSVDADELVEQSLTELDPVARQALLAEAEANLLSVNGYIPLGAPVRWSLVRGDIKGFNENRWSLHPLYPFSIDPT
ncbi:MAG: peptide ABC transporter substrate-binding protein [Sphingomonadaceae bacterium]|nr:peptide ABC transporter substrate-binding protein [Sphingomonadaceae bacterium]